MSAALMILVNGQPRSLPDCETSTDLASVLESLKLKADRIAVELNGRIVSRSDWSETQIATQDRLEIVHFVGGGCLLSYGAFKSV